METFLKRRVPIVDSLDRDGLARGGSSCSPSLATFGAFSFLNATLMVVLLDISLRR